VAGLFARYLLPVSCQLALREKDRAFADKGLVFVEKDREIPELRRKLQKVGGALVDQNRQIKRKRFWAKKRLTESLEGALLTIGVFQRKGVAGFGRESPASP
jgi:hypothetical protein